MRALPRSAAEGGGVGNFQAAKSLLFGDFSLPLFLACFA